MTVHCPTPTMIVAWTTDIWYCCKKKRVVRFSDLSVSIFIFLFCDKFQNSYRSYQCDDLLKWNSLRLKWYRCFDCCWYRSLIYCSFYVYFVYFRKQAVFQSWIVYMRKCDVGCLPSWKIPQKVTGLRRARNTRERSTLANQPIGICIRGVFDEGSNDLFRSWFWWFFKHSFLIFIVDCAH